MDWISDPGLFLRWYQRTGIESAVAGLCRSYHLIQYRIIHFKYLLFQIFERHKLTVPSARSPE